MIETIGVWSARGAAAATAAGTRGRELLPHTHGGVLLKGLSSERDPDELEQDLEVMTSITHSRCGNAFRKQKQ